MESKEILTLIDNISPHAKEYVEKAFENNRVDIIYSVSTVENMGVFIAVDNKDCCIFYAYFLNENNIEQILDIIKNKTKEYILKFDSKEICFNVYGNNLKIINEVRKLGFKVDIEGYHLEFIDKELSNLNCCNLIDKGFKSDMLKEFIKLFDSSYYQLNIDNGWQVNSNAINEDQFYKKLINLDKHSQVRSFWINNELVGAYIFCQNYITDIVVKPTAQNKGYGSYILAHCIRNMSMNESIRNIRLRVAKSNTGAKKLYERNGFIEIAYFSEHTYE